MKLVVLFILSSIFTQLCTEEKAMNPNDILFSTPTLNDAIPNESTQNKLDENAYITHEDNWRQFEFINKMYLKDVDLEVKAIKDIWNLKSVKGKDYTAFKSVHVRSKIKEPTFLNIDNPDLNEIYSKNVTAMSFLGLKHNLDNVQVVKFNGFALYRQLFNDKVVVIGLDNFGPMKASDEISKKISNFMLKNNLVLVHWTSGTIISDPEMVNKILKGEE